MQTSEYHQAEQVNTHTRTHGPIQERKARWFWTQAQASEYVPTGVTHGYTANRSRKVVVQMSGWNRWQKGGREGTDIQVGRKPTDHPSGPTVRSEKPTRG